MSISKYDVGIAKCLLGAGGCGAAGWIYGAAENLTLAGAPALDVVVVLSCAAAVFLTSVFWVCHYFSGRRQNAFVVVQSMLGASLVFGTIAVSWMHARGTLVLALDPNKRFPPALAFLAPLLILALMAALCWPPIRRRSFRVAHLRRGAPEAERWENLPI
jgi:hypothetical protein